MYTYIKILNVSVSKYIHEYILYTYIYIYVCVFWSMSVVHFTIICQRQYAKITLIRMQANETCVWVMHFYNHNLIHLNYCTPYNNWITMLQQSSNCKQKNTTTIKLMQDFWNIHGFLVTGHYWRFLGPWSWDPIPIEAAMPKDFAKTSPVKP